MFEQFASIVSFAAMGLAAYGLGRPIIRGLGVGQEDRLAVSVWSIATGLIAAGTFLAGLGLIGILYTPLIGVLTASACFWGLGELTGGYIRRHEERFSPEFCPPHRPDPTNPAPWGPPARWISCGVLLLAGVGCLGSLIGALAPPTAGDALWYHLEIPKIFLADHAITYLKYNDNSTFPLLVEMWYLWGLAIDGGVAAQLVHWGLGVLLGLATVLLATPIISRRWAWMAGTVVVLVPGVNNQMTAPLNDVGLTLLTTLAMAAWWRAAVNEEGRRWFVLSGLAAGGAAGTKYLALVFAAAVGATWVWALIRHRSRRRLLLEGAAIVAVVAVSTSGTWYVRAAWHRGNPVYPFLAEVFVAKHAPDAPHIIPPVTLPRHKSPLGRNPAQLLSVPWQVTMHPERFGGRGHRLGVLLLAAAPGLLLCRRLRGLGTLLAVAAVYTVLWFLLRQNVRFLFPVVPLVAVAVVWVWIEMRSFPAPARLICAATFAGILAACAAACVVRSADKLAVAVGVEDRQTYLSRNEPTWQAAEVANQILRRGARILSQDYRTFYFNHPITREIVYRRLTRYDLDVSSPAVLGERLRRDGFTHLLLAENLSSRGIQYDGTLSLLADAQRAARGEESLPALTEYRFTDSDGGVRRYRLMMLR